MILYCLLLIYQKNHSDCCRKWSALCVVARVLRACQVHLVAIMWPALMLFLIRTALGALFIISAFLVKNFKFKNYIKMYNINP